MLSSSRKHISISHFINNFVASSIRVNNVGHTRAVICTISEFSVDPKKSAFSPHNKVVLDPQQSHTARELTHDERIAASTLSWERMSRTIP